MATIKERAHQYGCKAAGGWYKGGMRGSVYEAHHDAYIEIATEQQKIDIEKACEAYCKTCDTKECEDFGCEYCCDWVEKFRKAMEE